VDDAVVVVVAEVAVAVEDRDKQLRIEVGNRSAGVEDRTVDGRRIAHHDAGQGGIRVRAPRDRERVVDHVAGRIHVAGRFIRGDDAADRLVERDDRPRLEGNGGRGIIELRGQVPGLIAARRYGVVDGRGGTERGGIDFLL